MEFEIFRTSREIPPIEEFSRYETEKFNNGHINTTFYIEISTFDSIIDIIKKYGDIIIRTPYSENGSPIIEIYDDYRE